MVKFMFKGKWPYRALCHLNNHQNGFIEYLISHSLYKLNKKTFQTKLPSPPIFLLQINAVILFQKSQVAITFTWWYSVIRRDIRSRWLNIAAKVFLIYNCCQKASCFSEDFLDQNDFGWSFKISNLNYFNLAYSFHLLRVIIFIA